MSAPPRLAVGLDVGGTRFSVGLVSEHGQLLAHRQEATPRAIGAPATLGRILALIREILGQAGEGEVCGIGVGFGGPVDYAAQRIRRSHHAPGWADVPLAEVLSRELRLPTKLENDANAGGLGESIFGAGRAKGDLLYVNIGTGVGGALILGGHVYHGANDNAGEFGHMILDPDGPPCPCGKRGCVEALCSGDALGRRARELAQAHPGAFGVPPEDLTGRRVGELARAENPAALRVLGECAGLMGQALASAANLLDPAVIVLGGGVPELGELYLEPVRAAFRAHAMPVPAERTEILGAALGYEAGVVGAAAVAFSELV